MAIFYGNYYLELYNPNSLYFQLLIHRATLLNHGENAPPKISEIREPVKKGPDLQHCTALRRSVLLSVYPAAPLPASRRLACSFSTRAIFPSMKA